jgi:hypothetical protein
MLLRVDSLIPGRGHIYVSDVYPVRSDGRFSMVVYRSDESLQPGDPDTASVEVKLYDQSVPPPDGPPLAAVLVRMTFAPRGAPVKPTVIELQFPYRP